MAITRCDMSHGAAYLMDGKLDPDCQKQFPTCIEADGGAAEGQLAAITLAADTQA